MPKLKSHTGAKKRFLRTSSGKWKYKKSGQRHLLTHKTSKNGRQSRRGLYLNDVDGEKMSRLLPYA